MFAPLALALLSVNAFASLPEGRYTGRCDGASTMQEFKNGKAPNDGMALSFYQLVDITVVKDGAATFETLKTKVFGERGPDGDEFEMRTKIEAPVAGLVNKTSLATGGGVTIYRVDADGSEVWIQSIDKDGNLTKAAGTSVSFLPKMACRFLRRSRISRRI